jgi:dipeptidase E
MRLYLSSFRLGNQPQRLVDLAGRGGPSAIIVNACDLMSDDDRTARVRQEIEALERLGFKAEEFDLRRFFHDGSKREELRGRLADSSLVWVRGGNAFVLRRAMKASGFDEMIREALQRDALAYGGFSAGIDMLGPSLHGVELVDDPHAVPEDYDPEVVWECLGLLPYTFAPHYRSDHPESADIEKSVQYYIDNHILFIALRDGQAVVIDGDRREVLL